MSASISKLLVRFLGFVSWFFKLKLQVALGCSSMGRKTTTTGPSYSGRSKREKNDIFIHCHQQRTMVERKLPKVIVHPLLMLLTNMNCALSIVSTLLDMTLLLVGELSSPNTCMSNFGKQLAFGTI